MKTVDQGFREFQTQLTTPDNESFAAKNHRASIEACLKERFGLTAFFQSGSFGNGTNVPIHSDVDRFAVIPRENLPRDSKRALRIVRQTLFQRFSTTLRIRMSPPAIIIPFGVDGLETTEVIPAFNAGPYAGQNVYAIPDPGAGTKWILSAPQALRAFINEVDAAQDNKLKPLIRSLKAWKYHRKVQVQSVYLELTCAALARDTGLLTTSIDIAKVLHRMRSNRLAVAHNPLGLGDPIPATRTREQLEEALSKVTGGANVATRAVTSELEWSTKAAFRRWKFFFGARFPNPE